MGQRAFSFPAFLYLDLADYFCGHCFLREVRHPDDGHHPCKHGRRKRATNIPAYMPHLFARLRYSAAVRAGNSIVYTIKPSPIHPPETPPKPGDCVQKSLYVNPPPIFLGD